MACDEWNCRSTDGIAVPQVELSFDLDLEMQRPNLEPLFVDLNRRSTKLPFDWTWNLGSTALSRCLLTLDLVPHQWETVANLEPLLPDLVPLLPGLERTLLDWTHCQQHLHPDLLPERRTKHLPPSKPFPCFNDRTYVTLRINT